MNRNSTDCGCTKQPHEVPRALETSEISRVVFDFHCAAERAKAAALIGLESHAAMAFLQSKTNRRPFGLRSGSAFGFLRIGSSTTWYASQLDRFGLAHLHSIHGLVSPPIPKYPFRVSPKPLNVNVRFALRSSVRSNKIKHLGDSKNRGVRNLSADGNRLRAQDTPS